MSKVPFFGDSVWRFGWWSTAASVLFAVGCSTYFVRVAFGGGTPAWWWLVCVAPLVIVWVCVLRPRVAIVDSEIVVVKWFRTVRKPLRDLVGADPGHYGTQLSFADGGSVDAGTLQRPNWAAWFGRLTRADKVAHQLLRRAALSRGEPPPSFAGPRRGAGDLSGGIAAALAALFNSN